MKRTMLQKFGILGLISLLSYTTAVVFAAGVPRLQLAGAGGERFVGGQRAVENAVESAFGAVHAVRHCVLHYVRT